jgi:hypothetical protein
MLAKMEIALRGDKLPLIPYFEKKNSLQPSQDQINT